MSLSDETELTRLHDACRVNDTKIILHFLHTPLIHTPDAKLGWTPLYRAVVWDHIKAVKILLQSGADPNAPVRNGQTPLGQAVEADAYHLAKYLLKNGADPNIQCVKTYPLHQAVAQQNFDMIMLLMRFGADLSLRNKETGQTVMEIAKNMEDWQIVRVLRNSITWIKSSPKPKDNTTIPSTPITDCRDRTDRTTFGYLDNTCEYVDALCDPLYNWLEARNLECIFTKLVESGYDNLDQLKKQINSMYPLTDEILQEIGISKKGHRLRLLYHLQTPSRIFFTSQTFESWLESVRLPQLTSNFVESGFEDLDFLLHKMNSENPMTDEILKKCVGIKKIGHRQRILTRLQLDAVSVRETGIKCESCSLL